MRISDWSSDVCSSDLTAPVSAKLAQPCAQKGQRSEQHEPTGDVDGRTRGSFIGGWIHGGFLEGPSCRPRPTGQSVTTLRDHRRARSEEHTSELQSLMRNSYAVFCLKKKKQQHNKQ